jgi:hypothetical protein
MMQTQNKAEAQRFLSAIDPNTDQFTWQTFPDGGKDTKLTRILHGSLDELYDKLVKLNELGAGIFITINETNLKGRKTQNIIRVRAVFCDLDGSPLTPALEYGFNPHMIVESSLKKWHVYWLVKDVALEQFSTLQTILAQRYNSDPKVTDLPRVMRVPGFFHQKDGGRFLTHIVNIENIPSYSANDILPDYAIDKGEGGTADDLIDDDTRTATAEGRLNTAALANLAAWVLAIFPNAKFQRGTGAYRIDSKTASEMSEARAEYGELEEDLSIHPEGIVDEGIKDMGDKRQGKRTPIDIIVEYGKQDYAAAKAWLRTRLGIDEAVEREDFSTDDFYAYMEMPNSYIYTPTGAIWPAINVNFRVAAIPVRGGKKIKANVWIAQNRHVEQMTWAPGHPQLIADKQIIDGGWIDHKGANCYNEYRPPILQPGTAALATPWVDHCFKVFNKEDATHIIRWLACRVQYPHIKINHALVLGSEDHGIGKDTLLEPIKHAVGPWNFKEISATQMDSAFNSYLQASILRINEVRDLGEMNRVQFYNHTKNILAAPPDVLRVNEKYIKEHYIFNCVGVLMTTNYKTNGLYLPLEDRRHYVGWSERKREDFTEQYWSNLWNWYYSGGNSHVIAYLLELDISDFDPKAPPARTAAFYAIVDSNQPQENSELFDLLDGMTQPNVITLQLLKERAVEQNFAGEVIDWLSERKNVRLIPQRLEKCGYVSLRNPDNKQGLWMINKSRHTVYIRREVFNSDKDAYSAIAVFIKGEEARIGSMARH